MLIQLFTQSMLLQFLDKWWNVGNVYLLMTDFTCKWDITLQLPVFFLEPDNRHGVLSLPMRS